MFSESSIKSEVPTTECKEETSAVDNLPGSQNPQPQIKEGEEKRRRAWAQWSPEEIAAFFEALNEHGKDFEAIQNYLVNKTKRKGGVNQPAAVIKNKDQVRHFYYRAWHKISKFLNIQNADDGKKINRELYGVINYGEMWKKLGGFFNERCGEKLNELVQHGVTTMKVKGKTIRIKTPVCPVLKRLQVPENEPPKQPAIPELVILELTPSCNADFLRVQAVAHNPRIRISAESRSPVADVISYLTKKWKPKSLHESETIAQDEVLLRLLPDSKQTSISNTADKKTRKRSVSEADPEDVDQQIRSEVIKESKSWTLDNGENTIGEIYASLQGSEGRLQLMYTWERRSLMNGDVAVDHPDDSCDLSSLLRALLTISKSCFAKTNTNADQGKKRRNLVTTTPVSEPQNRSPATDSSPQNNYPAESPIQASRTRQRLRRPLRYGSALKRGGLAVTMSKLPGPSQRPVQQPLNLVNQQQVNLTWSATGEGGDPNNPAAPIVFQMCLNSTQPQLMEDPPGTSQPTHLPESLPEQMETAPETLPEASRAPSVLNTPQKILRSIEWDDDASNAPSLSSTSQKLQEWMSMFLPSTPEKKGSSSVRSAPISLPESLSSVLAEGQNLLSSNWSNREGDEISLSSLLNQLVSPAKSTASSRYTELRLPHDLQSLVADNSVDLTAKFAELAACIAAAEPTYSSKNKQP